MLAFHLCFLGYLLFLGKGLPREPTIVEIHILWQEHLWRGAPDLETAAGLLLVGGD